MDKYDRCRWMGLKGFNSNEKVQIYFEECNLMLSHCIKRDQHKNFLKIKKSDIWRQIIQDFEYNMCIAREADGAL